MKASLVILLLASFTLLSFAQIAGGLNEAAPPPAQEENFDDSPEGDTPMDQAGALEVATVDTSKGYVAPARKAEDPVSFKLY